MESKDNAAVTTVTFSYLQIDTGTSLPNPPLDPPKIWDEHKVNGEMVMIHGSKLKHNYKVKTIEWDNMYRMVQSGYRAISQAVTRTGYMTDNPEFDEFISMKMVLLDFDEGFRLEEMKQRFSKYHYMIHTSRNHMKDKPKKGISERFRVILPLEHTHTDKEALKLAMKYLVEELYKDYGIDDKCKDLTRIMFAGGINCEYHYNKGIYFPMTAIISMAKEWDEDKRAERKSKYEAKAIRYSASTGDKTRADWYRENMNTPIMYEKLKYDEKAVSGRNNALHNIGLFLTNDVGLSGIEVANAILYINSQHGDPLDETEIERTLFRSLRIGVAA